MKFRTFHAFVCRLLALFGVAASAYAQSITIKTLDAGSGGDTGQFTSQVIVVGNPAVAYYNVTDNKLMFARNTAADGSGAWTISVVDNGGGSYPSLTVINGNPAISYQAAGNLRFARNSAADGSGNWTITTVDSGFDTGRFTSLAIANGNPAISYCDFNNRDLKFARNSAADGSGVWTLTTIDTAGDVGQDTALAILNGNPAIAYADRTNGSLKFARNAAADGSGVWTLLIVESLGAGQFETNISMTTSAAGLPLIACQSSVAGLRCARNSAADGSGTWTLTTVDIGNLFGTSIRLVNGNPAISYRLVSPAVAKFARNSSPDGSGTWTISTVDPVQDTGNYSSLAIVSGNPAISYYDRTNGNLKYSRNSAVDGSGTWTPVTIDTGFQSGDAGQFTSQRLVANNPAIAYYDVGSGDLKFARSDTITGLGTWTIATADSTGDVGQYCALAVLGNAKPAMSYYDATAHSLKFARNSAVDGLGTWTVTTVDNSADVGQHTSLAVIGGNPAISYYDVAAQHLKFARNSASDGSGTWTLVTVDSASGTGQFSSMRLVGGNPAIAYYSGHLKFARNSATDGSGSWTITTVDAVGVRGQFASLSIVGGNPAIAYYDVGNTSLVFTRNSAADGSGAWSTPITLDGNIGNRGEGASLINILPGNTKPVITYGGSGSPLRFARNTVTDASGEWLFTDIEGDSTSHFQFTSAITMSGDLGVSYYDSATRDLKWARLIGAEILVEEADGTDLADGSSRGVTIPINSNSDIVFTVRNIFNANLAVTSLSFTGLNAADFSITSPPASPVSPDASTTFTVRFAPVTAGTKTASLHFSDNDADENPFDINFTGNALSYTQDTDGDGLNDAAEFLLSPQGFDWQVSQPSLVNNLFSNANSAGLYTTSQVQALNMGVPLIQRNPTTGQFKLTIGIQKSTNLTNYVAFPFVPAQTVINGQGQIEFTFGVPDNAAFFRLEAH